MTATCYVTFGQKYRNETHPLDDRAHPDGWFTVGGTSPGARTRAGGRSAG